MSSSLDLRPPGSQESGRRVSSGKSEGPFLAVALLRLPHLKPLAADHHEAEEPDEKPEGGADQHKALGTIEPCPIGIVNGGAAPRLRSRARKKWGPRR